jgi:hypothetical protein
MGTSQRLDMLEKRAHHAITAKVAREAKRIVGIWNTGHAANRDLWFFPPIGAAIAAECLWLRFYCPAVGSWARLICAGLIGIVVQPLKV